MLNCDRERNQSGEEYNLTIARECWQRVSKTTQKILESSQGSDWLHIVLGLGQQVAGSSQIWRDSVPPVSYGEIKEALEAIDSIPWWLQEADLEDVNTDFGNARFWENEEVCDLLGITPDIKAHLPVLECALKTAILQMEFYVIEKKRDELMRRIHVNAVSLTEMDEVLKPADLLKILTREPSGSQACPVQHNHS